VLNPAAPLSAMIETLAGLPLVFHAGTAWEYSVATDVLGRLVEILSGQRFDAFIQSRILDRLGMMDTAFVVSVEKRHRFTAYYAGADLLDPMKPGLTRIDDAPYPGAYLSPSPGFPAAAGWCRRCPTWWRCCAVCCRAEHASRFPRSAKYRARHSDWQAH